MARKLCFALVLVGCGLGDSTLESFHCQSAAQCFLEGVEGQCEPDGRCSFPDPGCSSRRRYARYSGESRCVDDPSCRDGVRNRDEADVDCGGALCSTRCHASSGCEKGTDCQSGVCTAMQCAPPKCDDQFLNGRETDIDCGGELCGKCADKNHCLTAFDCQSGVCQQGQCVAVSCLDQTKSGSETDVDCGGACGACPDHFRCGAKGDCQSGVCTQGRCTAPSCSDQVKNGSEADTDCGGTCALRCPEAAHCNVNQDCTTGICDDVSQSCAGPKCGDGVRNGDETGADCGGLVCLACPAGEACKVLGDCQSLVCVASICQFPTCGDGVRNGLESDIDCGGSCMSKCATLKKCKYSTDCINKLCSAGKCAAPSCSDGIKNGDEQGSDCGGFACLPCIVFGNLVLYDTRSAAGIQAMAVANQPMALAVADINLDGKPDVVTANQQDNNLTVLLGQGDGTFVVPGQLFTATLFGSPHSVAIGDLNADGKPDLVTAGWAAPGAHYLLGNGNGTFQGVVFVDNQIDFQNQPGAALIADFNHDGKPDFMVANTQIAADTIDVYLNQGGGSFAKGLSSSAALSPGSEAAGDFNRDGHLDLVVSNLTLNQVSVLLGNGNGTFKLPQAIAVGLSPRGIAAADLNDDGKLDLVVLNTASSTASMLLGKGDGTFQNATTVALGGLGMNVGNPALVDMDRDGVLDLVTALQGSTQVAVLHGNHDGTFGKPVLISATACDGCNGLVATDLNEDGKLDVALACKWAPGLGVLLNVSP